MVDQEKISEGVKTAFKEGVHLGKGIDEETMKILSLYMPDTTALFLLKSLFLAMKIQYDYSEEDVLVGLGALIHNTMKERVK